METCTDGSPFNSKKEIPRTHNIETRYASYNRAKDYIKHLTKVIDSELQKSNEFDSSCIESLNFRSKLPLLNAKFKPSSFPAVPIGKEYLDRIAMVNAYNKLGELNIGKNKHLEKPIALSPVIMKRTTLRSQTFRFSEKKKTLCKKCNCAKERCKCRIKGLKISGLGYEEGDSSGGSFAVMKKKPPFVVRSLNKSFEFKKKMKLETRDENDIILSPRRIF
jgi:hypothetical protein